MKQKIISKLKQKYGNDWKTPLSKDLGVDVSTVRRIFNSRDTIPKRYVQAINNLLENHA